VADTWLCDAGLRVTNLERSVRFYTTLLDLVELQRVADDESAYVLFKDRRSGQRLELNWYSEKSPFYTPFVAGEGLDHVEVRCRSVAGVLARLKPLGVEPLNRKLWVNPVAVARLRASPAEAEMLDKDVWVSSSGHTIAYVADPDGNLICLYDHPEEDFDAPIPEHY
jgi:catechol 2,3-dioxygenase-like lactoylglutathione lyase family enzyme